MPQDINNAKTILYKIFNTNLNLNKNELTKEKHFGLGTFTKIDLVSLCEEILNEQLVVKINTIDIFYGYINK